MSRSIHLCKSPEVCWITSKLFWTAVTVHKAIDDVGKHCGILDGPGHTWGHTQLTRDNSTHETAQNNLLAPSTLKLKPWADVKGQFNVPSLMSTGTQIRKIHHGKKLQENYSTLQVKCDFPIVCSDV